MKSIEKFRFRVGQIVSKDELYNIMGIGGGDWWENVGGDDLAESVVITRSIKIDIIVFKEAPHE